jgi:hypothetical protein
VVRRRFSAGRGVMVRKKQLPPAILQVVREAKLKMLSFLQICRSTRVRVAGKIHPRIIAFSFDIRVIVPLKRVGKLYSPF